MPVHKHRQFERGYNQAQLLASAVAKTLSLPVDNHILRRKKSTKAQSSLNKKARKSNVNNAFICTPNNYQHIALIDDVITTGSTVNEACKILRSRGCKQISVWTICATPKHRKKGRKIS
jgi:ComF family protein